MNIHNKELIEFSKKELRVISASLLVFCHEMWRLSNKEAQLQPPFALEIAEVVRDFFIESRDKDAGNVCIFRNEYKKILIAYTALNECSKNFENYEVSIIGGITKEELDAVLQDFKRLFPELESKANK